MQGEKMLPANANLHEGIFATGSEIDRESRLAHRGKPVWENATRPYRSSTSAVLLAYAVLLASKKSVFTILALEYWLTQAISAGSER